MKLSFWHISNWK